MHKDGHSFWQIGQRHPAFSLAPMWEKSPGSISVLTGSISQLVKSYRVIVFVLAISYIVGTGCGNDSTGSVVNERALNHRVLALKQGTTIEAVKAQLGEPVTEFSESGES